MINKNNLETKSLQNEIEDFYGIHPFKKWVKYMVGPFGGLAQISDYTLEEFNEKKRNEKPSELIKAVSSLSGENYNESILNYGRVRKDYLSNENIPSVAWFFIGLYSKKRKEYEENCRGFNEFIRLWKASKANKSYKEI